MSDGFPNNKMSSAIAAGLLRTGTHDPTVLATEAPVGGLYLREDPLNPGLYEKLDAGTTTNWVLVSTGTSNAYTPAIPAEWKNYPPTPATVQEGLDQIADGQITPPTWTVGTPTPPVLGEKLLVFNTSSDPVNPTQIETLVGQDVTLTANALDQFINHVSGFMIHLANGVVNFGTFADYVATFDRNDPADQGTVALAFGFASHIEHINCPGITDLFASFAVANHNIHNPSVINNLYDFLATNSNIDAGVVTNRYGMVIFPDANYDKINWICDFVKVGGKSQTPNPDAALCVDGHIKGAQTTPPTTTVNANAGAGATMSVSQATDVAGLVEIVTGTGAASGELGKVNFTLQFVNNPIVQLTPANQAAADLSWANNVGIFASRTINDFSINATAAPPDTTTFQWFYQIIESAA